MATLPPHDDGDGGGSAASPMTEAEALRIWDAAGPSSPSPPPPPPAHGAGDDAPPLPHPPAAAVLARALADRDAYASYLRFTSAARRSQEAELSKARRRGRRRRDGAPLFQTPVESEREAGASFQDEEGGAPWQARPPRAGGPFKTDERDAGASFQGQEDDGAAVAPQRKSPPEQSLPRDLHPAVAAQARELERLSLLHKQRASKEVPDERAARPKSPSDLDRKPPPLMDYPSKRPPESDLDRKPPAFPDYPSKRPPEWDWDLKPPPSADPGRFKVPTGNDVYLAAPDAWEARREETTKIVQCPRCNASLCTSPEALTYVVCQVCCTLSSLLAQVERPR